MVAGTGSTDNASFNINGGDLRITASPNFETKSIYSVRIRTTDLGNLYTEKEFTITINDIVELPTYIINSNVEKIEVYPNPTSDFIQIKNMQSGAIVYIFDLDGRFIKHSTSDRIDLSGLNSGTYIVKVISEDKTDIIKVLKK